MYMNTFLNLQVDGDTDSPSVQREFEKIIRNHIKESQQQNNSNKNTQPMFASDLTKNTNVDQTVIQDLETNVPGTVPTISHHVSLMNGHLKTRSSNNENKSNGDLQNGQPMDFRHMLQEAERFPVDSYM